MKTFQINRFFLCLPMALLPSVLLAVMPTVKFILLESPPATVFFGERVAIKYRMFYGNLRYYQDWSIPVTVSLEANAGLCPSFAYQWLDWPWYGICDFSVILTAKNLNEVMTPRLGYRIYSGRRATKWDICMNLPPFAVKVIPHPLSLAVMPIQTAIVGEPFYFDIKAHINYYMENKEAGEEVTASVAPFEQSGLYFDKDSLAIIGKPSFPGSLVFWVIAKNSFGETQKSGLTINVAVNPLLKPVFKSQIMLPSARPLEAYSYNLLELLTPETFSRINEPIHFRIDAACENPPWLAIDSDNQIMLEGRAPYLNVEDEVKITLIASTYSGGDSKPLTVQIPVVVPLNKRPQLEDGTLEAVAGRYWQENLERFITGESTDLSLKLVLDKVEPEASWLRVSLSNPLLLEGLVPIDASGSNFELTLHINSATYGNSEPQKQTLRILIDKGLTPRFKAMNPQLPMLYPGLPFFYDFREHRDIFPEFVDAAYSIRLVNTSFVEDWLFCDGTKLVANEVPRFLNSNINLNVILNNKPGGDSPIIKLYLYTMGSEF